MSLAYNNKEYVLAVRYSETSAGNTNKALKGGFR